MSDMPNKLTNIIRSLAFITPDNTGLISPWEQDTDDESRIVGHWFEDGSTYYIVVKHPVLRAALILLQNNMQMIFDSAKERDQWRECAGVLAFALRGALSEKQTILNYRAFAHDGLAEFERLKEASK